MSRPFGILAPSFKHTPIHGGDMKEREFHGDDFADGYNSGYNNGFNEGFKNAKKFYLEKFKEFVEKLEDTDVGDLP